MKIAEYSSEAGGTVKQLKETSIRMLEAVVRGDSDGFREEAESVHTLIEHILGIEHRLSGKASMAMSIDDMFNKSFTELSSRIHSDNYKKGFWPDEIESRNPGEAIALMHSELSEALEAYRHGLPMSEKIPNFSNAEEEFADLIIRVMDFTGAHRMRIAEAVLAKLDYNRSRPQKHGKEF